MITGFEDLVDGEKYLVTNSDLGSILTMENTKFRQNTDFENLVCLGTDRKFSEMACNISCWTKDEVQSNLWRLDLSPNTLKEFEKFDGHLMSFLSKSDCVTVAMGVPGEDHIRILAMVYKEKERGTLHFSHLLHFEYFLTRLPSAEQNASKLYLILKKIRNLKKF